MANSKTKPKKTIARKKRPVFAWPYVAFLLLSVGVLLAGWTFQTGATDIKVTARIPAAPLTDPAIITSPTEGSHFSEIPITVKGTCPLDSYVSLYTNDFFRGSVICAAAGSFELSVDLFPGANHLKARVFNITDDEGPQSTPVNVVYDVPQLPPPAQPSQSSGSGNAPASSIPFTVKTNFQYVGYLVGQSANWNLDVRGGTGPYAINIDWGDGSNSVVSRKEAGELTVERTYKKRGNGRSDSFIIKITGSDSAGAKSYLQIFVIVRPSKIGSIIANTLPPNPPISKNWLLIIWPTYAVVVLMASSFTLGEHEELLTLKKRGLLRSKGA